MIRISMDIWIPWLCFFGLLQKYSRYKSNNRFAGKKRARDGLAIEENGDTIDSKVKSID